MRNLPLAAVAVLLGTALGPAVAAEVLYGVGGNGSNSPGALFTVDQGTGENTLVGDPVTPGGLSGAAFDSSGQLFGTTVAGSGSTSSLVEIHPGTGALLATVGTVTVSGGGPAISIGDLAFQPQTDVLFGLRSSADGGGGGGELYTIDVTTALATLVGASTPTGGGGLAFAPAGTLYRSGNTGVAPNPMVISILDPTDASTLQTFSGFITIFFDGLAVRPGDGLLFATGSGGVHTVDLVGSVQTTLSPGPPNGDTMSDLDFRPAVLVPALPGPPALLWIVTAAGLVIAARCPVRRTATPRAPSA